ncbi:hypothetical protein ACF0H5_008058 [Mactra antiquata]
MADTSCEQDAVPDAPIPRQTQNKTQSVEQTRNLQEKDLERSIQRDTQVPTEDWQFKHMLVEVAEQMTDDNLNTMKFLFSGDGGLGNGVLEKIKSPLELFLTLERRRWLTRDNLLRLQCCLKAIGRKDLIRVAADYAQKIGNVLHFYHAPEPENGYTSAKLHIDGHSYNDATRDTVQEIRTKFAELLCCPPEFIVIAGVEPATSLILTFHIPEFYMDIFKDLLKISTFQARLKDICIDIVEIEGEEGLIDCSDEYAVTKSATEQQRSLKNVYQLLEEKTKVLDSAEIELLHLNKRVDMLEKDLFNSEALLKSMKPEFDESGGDKKDLLKKFETLLKRPELGKYDKALILSLLDVNTKMVANAVAENDKRLIAQLQLDVQILQERILPLQFELLKLRIFSNQEEIGNLPESFRQLLESISISKTVKIMVDEDFIKILKKIGAALRFREKEKLEKMYTWEPNEDIKRDMDNDSSFCLVGILYKEIIKTEKVLDPVQFISKCLKEVNRKDLEKKFQELLSSLERSREARDRANMRKQERSKSLDRENDNAPQVDKTQLQKIADQVNELHEIIIPAHKAMKSSSYFDMLSSKRSPMGTDESNLAF